MVWAGKGKREEACYRLSIVDQTRGEDRYRHALLVTDAPDSEKLFEPLPISHCSETVIDSLLIMADGGSSTLRVFNLKSFFRAASDSSKANVGLLSHSLYARNYRYILPQVGALAVPDGLVPEAIGSASGYGEQAMVIAGRPAGNVGASRRVLVCQLQEDRLKLVPGREESEIQCDGRVCGIGCSGGLVTALAGEGRKQPLVWHKGNAQSSQFPWPTGTSGFHHDPISGNLWGLTTGMGRRVAFRKSLSSFDDGLGGRGWWQHICRWPVLGQRRIRNRRILWFSTEVVLTALLRYLSVREEPIRGGEEGPFRPNLPKKPISAE